MTVEQVFYTPSKLAAQLEPPIVPAGYEPANKILLARGESPFVRRSLRGRVSTTMSQARAYLASKVAAIAARCEISPRGSVGLIGASIGLFFVPGGQIPALVGILVGMLSFIRCAVKNPVGFTPD